MTNRQSSVVDKALKLVAKGMSKAEAAKKCGVARSTIYRALARKSNKEGLSDE